MFLVINQQSNRINTITGYRINTTTATESTRQQQQNQHKFTLIDVEITFIQQQNKLQNYIKDSEITCTRQL